jgi:hypothetical protein
MQLGRWVHTAGPGSYAPAPGPSVAVQFAPYPAHPLTSGQHAAQQHAPMMQANPHFMYNTIQFPTSAPLSQYHPTPTPISVTPATPVREAPPSPVPARGRKRKTTTPGRRGGGRKRSRAAVIDTGPVSAQCGVGPLHAGSSKSPTSSPHPLPIGLPLRPVSGASEAPNASLQVPTASYASLHANRRPRANSNSATDVYYFCRTSDSDIRPETLPPPDTEQPLTKKPRSSFLSCKLCK